MSDGGKKKKEWIPAMKMDKLYAMGGKARKRNAGTGIMVIERREKEKLD